MRVSGDMATQFANAIGRQLPPYTRVDVTRIEEAQCIRFYVTHAGITRTVEADPVHHGALVAGAQRAIATAHYLDDLRQGMRDLIDQ